MRKTLIFIFVFILLAISVNAKTVQVWGNRGVNKSWADNKGNFWMVNLSAVLYNNISFTSYTEGTTEVLDICLGVRGSDCQFVNKTGFQLTTMTELWFVENYDTLKIYTNQSQINFNGTVNISDLIASDVKIDGDLNVTGNTYLTNLNLSGFIYADNYYYLNGNSINATVDAKLLGNYWFFANNYTLYGTVKGFLNDTKQYDNYDGISLNFTEAVPTGFEYYANTTNNVSTGLNKVCIRYKATSEDFNLLIWDVSLSDWESYGTLTSNSDFDWFCTDIRDSTDHLVSSKILIKVIDNGLASTQHKLSIDAMYVSSGYTPRVGNEVDPLSVHTDGDVGLTDDWDVGGYSFINLTSINGTGGILKVVGNLNVTGTSYLSGFTIADDLIVGNINISGTSNKIGIGTTSPTSALHVIGDLNVTGNITADWSKANTINITENSYLHNTTISNNDNSHSWKMFVNGSGSLHFKRLS